MRLMSFLPKTHPLGCPSMSLASPRLDCLPRRSAAKADRSPHGTSLSEWRTCALIDNVAGPFTVGVPLTEHYETHLPAIQAHTQTPAWVSRSHEDKRRARHARAPPTARPQTSSAEGCRASLPQAHAGVGFCTANGPSEAEFFRLRQDQ